MACTPERLFEEVADLEGYPRWLGLVRAVEPTAAVEGDPGPAWRVDLGARLGPFSQTKRVRMVRGGVVAPTSVRFERREADGDQHSPWVMEAEVAPTGAGARVGVHLHYGGTKLVHVLEFALRSEVSRATPRLRRIVEASSRQP